MSDVVVVPAWRRPDFLHAALTRLAAADDGATTYLISLDRGADPDCAETAARFAARHPGRVHTTRRGHAYPGNSFNVLSAYTEALDMRAGLIHLVEEDVLVGADYLTAARAAHALCPDAFAASLCRNQNTADSPPADDLAVYPHRSYQSLAVSFRPDRLAAILPHLGDTYFTDPVGYCRKAFPDSRIPAGHAEQDGLLHRIAEAEQRPTVYACSPRAYHAGWHGYHRRGRPLTGSVDERAERILAMTADDLNRAARSHPDHHTVDLDAPRPAPARVIAWP